VENDVNNGYGALLGIRFKCAQGHEWEAAVGGVWLRMPWCPVCKMHMEVPAVAWIGRWANTPPVKEVDRGK